MLPDDQPEVTTPRRKRVTRHRRDLVLERDGAFCAQCGWKYGDPIPRNRRTGFTLFRCLEIDHIVPVARGGTNDLSNLQILCSSCNASKGARVQ